MASVFRRNRLEPVPVNAEIREINKDDERAEGKLIRVARWRDETGKWREAKLNNAGDKIILPPAKDEPYYIAYDDENGQRRTVKAHRDKEASEAMGRRLEQESARRREGLVDPFEQHRRTPIMQHVEGFFAGQRAKRSPQKRKHIETIISATGATRLHELDTPRIDKFLQERQRSGMSDRTVNEYITSIKELTRWALLNQRLSHDPLVGLKRIGQRAVRPKHARRALDLESVAKLLDAAERRPLMELRTIRTGARRGQLAAKVGERATQKARRTGQERRLCYLLAFFGRLRRSEIRALQWGDIHLDSVPAKIVLRAKTTKAKRADSLPLHPQLADELRRFRPPDFRADQRVVKTVPDMKAFRSDLKLAGISDKDADDRFADFHALGKSFITAMAVHGVSQRAAQAIARHTDPRLTASAYTDEALLPLAAEMAKVPWLPDLTTDPPATLPLRATGTDDTAAGLTSGLRAAPAQRNGDFASQVGALPVTMAGSVVEADGEVWGSAQVAKSSRPVTQPQGPTPGGIGPSSRAGDRGRTDDIHVGNSVKNHAEKHENTLISSDFIRSSVFRKAS
jgi:integrase